MVQTFKILSGDLDVTVRVEHLNVEYLPYSKYAAITSLDVERSYLQYKNTLSNNRRSFNFESMKKPIVIQYNHSE